ncbi:hypothetical protein ASF88_18560 [Leifsonia sp. Leaf336]|uniref:hypothetical protein n=1 Tax=Leifsonia sp. Leaf336 TaxID=1736341 RepID=UPI0006F24329|nr:hypothetical protein [Leifsonia sp. Leaf336]KQR51187.1 hypothetical protein ASF88_18560 [Leifsonia sp. Leaf336]
MRSRSRPEWLGGDLGDLGDREDEVLPAVSTSSQAFAAILDDLVRAVDADVPPATASVGTPTSTRPASPKGTWLSLSDPESDNDVPLERPSSSAGGVLVQRAAPGRLRGKGDLTLVVGLGADAQAAATILAASADADVLAVADRREALAARAEGVRRECAIVGVVELPRVDAVPALSASLAGIEPDQVWVAVDVSRRLDDTVVWVRAVDAVLAVDGIAAHGAALTATPWAVGALGLPLLWLDAPPGPPSTAATSWQDMPTSTSR